MTYNLKNNFNNINFFFLFPKVKVCKVVDRNSEEMEREFSVQKKSGNDFCTEKFPKNFPGSLGFNFSVAQLLCGCRCFWYICWSRNKQTQDSMIRFIAFLKRDWHCLWHSLFRARCYIVEDEHLAMTERSEWRENITGLEICFWSTPTFIGCSCGKCFYSKPRLG